ncbi:MAG: hypothetical protein KBD29_00930 [Candidatus Magasanikbacteria bacterium]|nr:hypothetical protein [Candidatus Magasanikbacteria bacterium]
MREGSHAVPSDSFSDSSDTREIPNHEVIISEPSVETEFELLRDFYNGVRTIEDFREARESNHPVWLFQYGSKNLFLYLWNNHDFVDVLVSTDKDKEKDETTILYKKVKQIMQKYADTSQKSFNYELITDNPKLIEWAKIKGSKIFQWRNPKGEPFSCLIQPTQVEDT